MGARRNAQARQLIGRDAPVGGYYKLVTRMVSCCAHVIKSISGAGDRADAPGPGRLSAGASETSQAGRKVIYMLAGEIAGRPGGRSEDDPGGHQGLPRRLPTVSTASVLAAYKDSYARGETQSGPRR